MRIRLAVAVLAALASVSEAQKVDTVTTEKCVKWSFWTNHCEQVEIRRPVPLSVKPETTFVASKPETTYVQAPAAEETKTRTVRSASLATSPGHEGFAVLNKKNTRRDLFAAVVEADAPRDGLALNTRADRLADAVRAIYPEFGIENRQGLVDLIRKSTTVACPKVATPMAWIDRAGQVRTTGWSRVLGTGVNEGEMCLEYNGKIWASLLCGNPIIPPQAPRVSLAPPPPSRPAIFTPPSTIVTVEKRGFPWLKTALWAGGLGGAGCLAYGLLNDPHHRRFGCLRVVQITRVY